VKHRRRSNLAPDNINLVTVVRDIQPYARRGIRKLYRQWAPEEPPILRRCAW
jgi:hypothetical protein